MRTLIVAGAAILLSAAGCGYETPERSVTIKARDNGPLITKAGEQPYRIRIVWDVDSIPDTLHVAMPHGRVEP